MTFPQNTMVSSTSDSENENWEQFEYIPDTSVSETVISKSTQSQSHSLKNVCRQIWIVRQSNSNYRNRCIRGF